MARILRSPGPRVLPAALAGLALLLAAPAAMSQTLANSALGANGTQNLDTAAATVTLTRLGSVASAAVAEIDPVQVFTGVRTDFAYSIVPTIGAGDSGIQEIEITIPPGFTGMAVTGVEVAGAALRESCLSPAADTFCPTVTDSTIRVLLGQKMATSQARLTIRFQADPPATAGFHDFPSLLRDGALSLACAAGDADGVPGNGNGIRVETVATQGVVLEIEVLPDRSEMMLGGVATLTVPIRNRVDTDVVDARIDVELPPPFRFVDGTARLDGQPLADPDGGTSLAFPVGTVPARADADGNGTIDPGEPGYRELTFRMVAGSSARRGTWVTRAVARDYCDACAISNEAEGEVRIDLDPDFERGTVLGKVFLDRDGNGHQDRGEDGVPHARVVLDDGSYVTTDEHGRYHFPFVEPGQRLVKVDLASVGPGTRATDEESRIVRVTPGLLVKANFPVWTETVVEEIGQAAVEGISLVSLADDHGIDVVGNLGMMKLLVNGTEVRAPAADVSLSGTREEDRVDLRFLGDAEPARFDLTADRTLPIASWALTLTDAGGQVLRRFEGEGAPPASVRWNGSVEAGHTLEPGQYALYQLEVRYEDGTRVTSARRQVGVIRSSVASLKLTGSAFESNSFRLSEHARRVLDGVVEQLRAHPEERIVVEGHTDAVGDEEYNRTLSERRAQAAVDYLVEEGGLPRKQFTVRGFGEDRPVASNDLPEGRALNRRIVLRGELEEIEDVDLLDQFRTDPELRVDGEPVELDSFGRFSFRAPDRANGRLEVSLRDTDGRSLSREIPIPVLRLAEIDSVQVVAEDEKPDPGLLGWTDPRNSVEVDGEPRELGADGAIVVPVDDAAERSTHAVFIRNPEGFARIVNLNVDRSETDAAGRRWVVEEEIPRLTVRLPAPGVPLETPSLPISGWTEPGNRVDVNGQDLPVDAEGRFSGTIELEPGSRAVVVTARDPEGNEGSLEREVEVAGDRLFLLAFVDTEFGQLQGDGRIEAAGLDEEKDFYHEGRLAYYLKGYVRGRWLITSAFDSGRDDLDKLFDDLGPDETARLFRNLDPDRLYPVYGDGSTVTYDSETQGKFYLAIEADEGRALFGNYPVSFDDTELASYRRTLYGGQIDYRSVAVDSKGSPVTRLIVFGADVNLVHARNELRATGGSLYYLSHRDVVEGSEQVTLVVRDKTTGLLLRREPQRRGVDYTVKYPEGRILFRRPVRSVDLDGTLVDEGLLAGNPVWVEVDFEARSPGFSETAFGARARQKVGPVAVGGTYVDDPQAAGSYELQGVDAELEIGKNSRIVAELAESEGAESRNFRSEDGGLSWLEVAADSRQEGQAWKVAAELDAGDWIERASGLRLGAYHKDVEAGFTSGFGSFERGTQKTGGSAGLSLGTAHTLELRYHREELEAGPAAVGGGTTRLGSALWRTAYERWSFAMEVERREAFGAAAAAGADRITGAAELSARVTEDLTARVEHQATFEGPDNRQTTLGLGYRLADRLSLDVEGTDGDRGRSAQAGALWELPTGRVYLNERFREDRGDGRTATVLGAETAVGRASRVYTEYQWERSDTGDRTISLLGAQRAWEPGEGLRLVLGAELSEIDAGGPADRERSAASGSISYGGRAGLEAQSRNEIRFETGDERRRQFLTVNRLDVSVTPDFTLVARYRYSRTEDRDDGTVEARLNEGSVGLAYRPVGNDRLNGFARYTRLVDLRPRDPYGIAGPERTSDVMSLEGVVEVTPRLQWYTKGAARFLEESDPALPDFRTHTYLGIQRLDWSVRRPIDLGVEYRVLHQKEADDLLQGWLTEVSGRVQKRLRLGVGYNFTDFSDNEFTMNDYSVRGWFVRLQGKY